MSEIPSFLEGNLVLLKEADDVLPSLDFPNLPPTPPLYDRRILAFNKKWQPAKIKSCVTLNSAAVEGAIRDSSVDLWFSPLQSGRVGFYDKGKGELYEYQTTQASGGMDFIKSGGFFPSLREYDFFGVFPKVQVRKEDLPYLKSQIMRCRTALLALRGRNTGEMLGYLNREQAHPMDIFRELLARRGIDKDSLNHLINLQTRIKRPEIPIIWMPF